MNDLILHTLVLSDFRSFSGRHEFVLDRPPGLYHVRGVNMLEPRLGSNDVGKTTLWDALRWVLWGTTGRDRRPADAVVPWDEPGASTWVSLKFERAGKITTLRRSRNPNRLTAARRGDEREIDQKEVAGLLGMGEGIFSRSVLLGQFDDLFLDLSPEQQSQMFNEALNLGLWLQASGAASKQERAAAMHAQELGRDLSSVLGAEAADQQSLEQERERRQTYAQRAAVELNGLVQREQELELALGHLADECAGISSRTGGGRWKAGSRVSLVDHATREAARLGQEAQGCGREAADVRASLAATDQAARDLQQRARDLSKSRAGRTCPECGQKVPTAHLETKLAEVETKLAALGRSREPQAGRLDQLGLRAGALEADRRMLLDVSNRASRAEADLATIRRAAQCLRDDANPHDESVERLRRRLEEHADKKMRLSNAVAAAEKRGQCAAYWVDGFREIRLSIVDRVLGELEAAVTSHAERLGLDGWRAEFATEKQNKSGTTSAAFSVLLHPPGAGKPVKWESYGGGVSQRWQMAAAFALGEVVLARAGVQPNVEIYDEPTKHTSDVGVEELLEHLAERARELGRAIYVVEHHSLERGVFDGVITIEKTAEGSRILE